MLAQNPKYPSILLTLILLLFLKSCQNAPDQIPVGELKFAADLYDVIGTENIKKNIVYSPVSIQFSLGVLFFGATGSTAEELRNSSRLGDGLTLEIVSNFNDMLYAYGKSKVSPVLKIANRIFVSDASEISDIFQMIANHFYETSIEAIDFAKPKKAADKINNFVAERTGSYIDKIISQDDIGNDTKIAIFNVAVLKGQWKHPFDPKLTTKDNFYLLNNKTIAVDTLTKIEKFSFAELPLLKAKLIRLPYKNSDLGMVIVMPDKVKDLYFVEKKLSKLDWVEVIRTFQETLVEVKLPKFKIVTELDLTIPMKKLGIKSAFTKEARFGEVSSKEMHVSVMKHKARIEVNESNTTASAGSNFHVMSRTEALKFHVNRPFVFAITNNRDIFFNGHVINPEM